MKKILNYPPILPEGITDLLENKALQESSLVESLMKNFKLNGYKRVNPPLIEYEKNFKLYLDTTKDENIFRIIDPISNKPMFIRNDITPQIARIASNKKIDQYLPLRLSYTGYVLRPKGNQLHPERQIRQAGIELFNNPSNQAAIEVISVGLESLKKVKISNLIIDITIPNLANIILKHFKLNKGDIDKTNSYLKMKNITKIKTIPKCGKILSEIADSAGEYERAIKKLQKINLPLNAKKFIKDVKAICKGIKKLHNDINITIDPLENRGFNYYSGIGFAIFSENIKRELCFGGQYTINANNKNIYGMGLSILFDGLLKSTKISTNNKVIFIPLNHDKNIPPILRKKGWITVLGYKKSKSELKNAMKANCTYILEGKKIKKI
tara:strand:+ start:15659 stop:16804 length:1146 start_codon:yes stop_codon:yes gene_type:complete